MCRFNISLYFKGFIYFFLMNCGMYISLPFGFSRVVVAISFLAIGNMLNTGICKEKNKMPHKKRWIINMGCVLFLSIVGVKNYSSYVSNIYSNVATSIISAFAGTRIVFELSKLIDEKYGSSIGRIFSYLGKNTKGVIFFTLFLLEW